MARIFLSLVLAPGLGALSGGLAARALAPLLASAKLGRNLLSPDELWLSGLLFGGSLGFVLACCLIWCAFRPRTDPRKRAADVVLLLYGAATLIALRTAAPWAAALTIVVWLVGAAITLWALRRSSTEPQDEELPARRWQGGADWEGSDEEQC